MPGKAKIGSSFDEFLKEDGIYEDVTAVAVKRSVAAQIAKAMADGMISKAEMARRMKTSRSQLDRFLDPRHTKLQLDTLIRAARVLGRDVKIELT